MRASCNPTASLPRALATCTRCGACQGVLSSRMPSARLQVMPQSNWERIEKLPPRNLTYAYESDETAGCFVRTPSRDKRRRPGITLVERVNSYLRQARELFSKRNVL